MGEDRDNQDVMKSNHESEAYESTSHWVACHRPFLDDKNLSALANVIPRDFARLPDVHPVHSLEWSGICNNCMRRGITEEGLSDTYVKWARHILNHRPAADQSYDQAPIGYKQALKNISYILSAISDERQFAFLGDDDFHSILLGKILPNINITVFEADSRVTEAIEEIAEKESLAVSVIRTDMRDGIPCKYHGKFEAFYTDPPYSEQGALLFLYWGIKLLNEHRGSWGVTALPYTVLPRGVREMLLNVQEFLIKGGFLIEDSIPYFKQSPNSLGIISGILKFRRIMTCPIDPPESYADIYRHYY